jgi:hypothetical protein
MSGPTTSSMHDARDVEDKRLLETGEHKLLAGLRDRLQAPGFYTRYSSTSRSNSVRVGLS